MSRSSRARPQRPAHEAESDKSAPSVRADDPAPDRFASGYDFILANGPVDRDMFNRLLATVNGRPRNTSAVLFLVTYGGLANFGYRIGRTLQNFYDEVVVFVPSVCKSAGTLIVCAANELVMSPFGEIGPLDVQLLKRDELFERRSGLLTSYALAELKIHSFEVFEHFLLNIKARGGSISLRMAAEVASEITTGIMKHAYENINIESLGEDARNLAVATEYGDRLDQRFRNLRQGAIQQLVHDYPSHDFIIDVEEARTLFERVSRPTGVLMQLFAQNVGDMMLPRDSDTLVKVLTLEDENDGDEPDGSGDRDAGEVDGRSPDEE